MPSKNKKKSAPSQLNEFTHDSKRYCDICGIQVHIGVGGETNWKYHIDSSSHRKTAIAKASTRPISTFFTARSKNDNTTREEAGPSRGNVSATNSPSEQVTGVSDSTVMPTNNNISNSGLRNSDPVNVIDLVHGQTSFEGTTFHVCEDGCHCKVQPSANTCPGYKLLLPRDHSPFTSYPFLVHTRRDLPWDVFIQRDNLILRSHMCSGVAKNSTKSCFSCQQIHDHNIISGLRFRLLDGAPESTPWVYLTIAQMYAALKKKSAQINKMKLNSLNAARKIKVRNDEIDEWKRLSVAISTENIPRIRQLIAKGCRQGKSVSAMLEDVDRAARGVYRPRGYELADYQRSFLMYSLGGRSAAVIAQRSFGLPCINTTKKHIVTNPIRPSPKYPTDQEMCSNIQSIYPRQQNNSGNIVVGVVMQADEINLQERLCWESTSNMFIGVCREHGGKCSLEFNSEYQADIVLSSLREKKIHLATEATVVACSLLSIIPSEYASKPFIVSGSCKREAVREQKRLLYNAVMALKSSLPAGMQLYCIATDGDSRRRSALMDLTLSERLSPDNKLYNVLSLLPLFNLLVGPDDITCDFDTKHVLKRFRNTDLRQRGFSINGVQITIDVLRRHLLSLPKITSSVINSILQPNDKQDVVLMMKLLHAISCLPECDPTASPTVIDTRRVLRLLGKLYFFLLQSYLNVELSLDEQLTYLSAAAHMILALYHENKGEFIPVQLYFDVQCMIKNVYITVAKVQIDNPDGQLSILALGTDGLEKVFGKVRTMVGSDTNVDQLQLANRINAAVQCINILEEHPEWGAKARRLEVKPLSDNIENLNSQYDHVSPRTWKGNIYVKNVVLEACWKEGRSKAEDVLREAAVPVPFDMMEEAGGFDMLCPFGEGKVVLANGKINEGESDQTEEECDIPTPALPAQPPIPLDELDLEPDVEDLAGVAEAAYQGDEVRKFEPWVYISSGGNAPPKKIHKASVARLYSSPFAMPDSKDRLRRVRGYSQFSDMRTLDETYGSAGNNETFAEGLCVEDPAVTLVRCTNSTFLALVQVKGIRVGNNNVGSISTNLLHEPNVKIDAQIMKLALRDTSQQPDGPDWEWIGSYEHLATLRDADGRWFEAINPVLIPASRGRNKGANTFVFQTSELQAFAALIYERIRDESNKLPVIKLSDSFPYRAQSGACFCCETSAANANDADARTCRFCPNVNTGDLSAPALLKHMGAHILHDTRLRDVHDACGFCLSTTNVCVIHISTKGELSHIVTEKSTCPNLRKVQISKAKKFTDRSPCTNHPLKCTLCPPEAPAVWKYNLKSHIRSSHPTATLELEEYKTLYDVSKREETLMKEVYLAKPRISKRKRHLNERLVISEGHSTMALIEDDGVNDVGLEDTIGDSEESDNDGSEESEDESADKEGDSQHNVETVAVIDEVEDSTSSRPKRRRKAVQRADNDYTRSCEDIGCGGDISSEELLECCSPGCTVVYHLTCRGLIERPETWFCDDECRKNAGYRVGGGRKRRKMT